MYHLNDSFQKRYSRDHFSLLKLISLRHEGGNSFVKTDVLGILHKNIDILQSKDHEGNTIIHSILQSKFMDNYLKLQILIFVNINIVVEYAKVSNSKGMLPLHLACIYCSDKFEIIEIILRSYPEALLLPVNGKVKINGSCPLHLLVSNNPSIASVKLLIDKQPDILVQGDSHGATPLSVALRNRAKFHIVQYLINMNKSVLFFSDKRMNVPLHVACSWGPYSLNVIKILVEESRDTLFFVNADGKTPLDLAQSFSTQSDEIIDYLQNAAYNNDMGLSSDKTIEINCLKRTKYDSSTIPGRNENARCA